MSAQSIQEKYPNQYIPLELLGLNDKINSLFEQASAINEYHTNDLLAAENQGQLVHQVLIFPFRTCLFDQQYHTGVCIPESAVEAV